MARVGRDIEFILSNLEDPLTLTRLQLAIGVRSNVTKDKAELVINRPIWTFMQSRGNEAPQNNLVFRLKQGRPLGSRRLTEQRCIALKLEGGASTNPF